MADDQVAVTKIDKLMQQSDRIAAAGDADEVARPWRESGGEVAALDHEANVQRRTHLRKATAWQAPNVQCRMQRGRQREI